MVHVPKRYRKLFQDAIVVDIPLHVTADLGMVVRRSRAKRIRALKEAFPSLQQSESNKMEASDASEDNNNKDEDDEENDHVEKKKDSVSPPAIKKPRLSDSHVPQRSKYGSIVDYLEAKYVRGVMLNEDEEDEYNDEDEKGSVYSESSFVDDSLLKRDVAEQVMSQSTQTKLELENVDDEFFVNVGTLEVDEDTMLEYDPREEEKLKKPAKRKRAKSADSKATKKAKTQPGSSSAKKDAGNNSKKASTPKKTKPQKDAEEEADSTKSEKEEKAHQPAETAPDLNDPLSGLRQAAEEKKVVQEMLYDDLVQQIKAMTDEQLPLKKKLVKISLQIPAGMKPGGKIRFSNPHDPGQTLAVNTPKNKPPGSKFFVNVPVPAPADVTDNKLPREFSETLADYSTAYDEWVSLDAAYHEADPERKGKYKIQQTKLAKFDELIKVFPEDLVQPVDADYLRKAVRRARQNRQKREKTAAKAAAAVENSGSKEPTVVKTENVSNDDDDDKASVAKKIVDAEPEEPSTIELNVPATSMDFMTMTIDVNKFDG